MPFDTEDPKPLGVPESFKLPGRNLRRQQEEFEQELRRTEQRSFWRTVVTVLSLVIIGAAILAVAARQARRSAEESMREAEYYQSQTEQSKAQLETLRKSLSDSREAVQYVSRGINLYHAGNYRGAVGAYGEALKLDPENPYILDLEGYSLFKLGDYKGAIASAQAAVEIRPDYAWGHYDLARFYCAEKKFSLATASAKSAVRIRPDLKEAIARDGEFERLCAPVSKQFRANSSDEGEMTNSEAIKSSIGDIREGAHQALPEPNRRHVFGDAPGWSIKNSTLYDMQVYISGPVQRQSIIHSGSSFSFDPPPGSYELAVKSSEENVRPFYGKRKVEAGDLLEDEFYIEQHEKK